MDHWSQFTQSAARALMNLQRREISMEEAYRFFEANSALIADDDAVQSIMNAISEIDGFPRWYDEFSELLASQPTRDALVVWLKG